MTGAFIHVVLPNLTNYITVNLGVIRDFADYKCQLLFYVFISFIYLFLYIILFFDFILYLLSFIYLFVPALGAVFVYSGASYRRTAQLHLISWVLHAAGVPDTAVQVRVKLKLSIM